MMSLRPSSGLGALAALALTIASVAHAQPAATASGATTAPKEKETSSMRWRLRHGRELSGTVGIRHSERPLSLPEGRPIQLDRIRFEWPAGTVRSFEDYRTGNVLDGLVVLKDGHIVFEQYFDGFGPRDTHNWASVSKSVVGILAERLVRAGKIDPDAPVGRYVPDLAGTPFGAATIRQNLDMSVSVVYPANLPPDRGLFAAAGLAPVPVGAPTTIRDFLGVAGAGEAPNGSHFYYQNGSAEAAAWAIERATGKPLSQLVAAEIWGPMGADDDGYYLVDRQQTAFASGGLSSTLRDLARFGEFVRNQDRGSALPMLSWNGARTAPGRGFRYRSFWWLDERGAFGLGRFGQRLAIIPEKGLVIAQFGTYQDERPRPISGGNSVPGSKEQDLRDGEAFQALVHAIADQVEF